MSQGEKGFSKKKDSDLSRRDFLKLAIAVGVAVFTIYNSFKNFVDYPKPDNEELFYRDEKIAAWLKKLLESSKTSGEKSGNVEFNWRPAEPLNQNHIELWNNLTLKDRPLKNIPQNTVFIYFPGAEEKNISQIIEDKEIIDWFYYFLLGKGWEPEKAEELVSSFSSEILAIDKSNWPMEVKQARALKLMRNFGLYFLPWGWFDSQNQRPQTMVQAVVALIESQLSGQPIFFAGYSLGGLSQRILLNGYLKGNLKININPVGAVFLSEGYFGDYLAYVLFAFKDKIGELIKPNDEETGIYLIEKYPLVKRKWWWRFFLSPLGLEKILDSFIDEFKKEPKALGRIVRLIFGSLYHPEYLVGLRGDKLSFPLVSVRSLKDPHSIFSVIPGGLEFAIISGDRIIYRRSNFSLPKGFDLSTHRKFPELAFYCFE